MDEMLEIVMDDGTTIKLPMRRVLVAFAKDLHQAGNVMTRRMVEWSPGRLIEVTAKEHEGRLKEQSLERMS